jgi:hypothetical protein
MHRAARRAGPRLHYLAGPYKRRRFVPRPARDRFNQSERVRTAAVGGAALRRDSSNGGHFHIAREAEFPPHTVFDGPADIRIVTEELLRVLTSLTQPVA